MFSTSERRRVQQFFPEKGICEQSHKDSCDIHTIMRKYEKTGIVQHVNEHKGTYGNYIGAPDYKAAHDAIAAADSLFESIPARIRNQFDNDPGKFVSFMQNVNNRDKIISMGLDASHLPVQAVSVPVATPPKVEPLNEPKVSEKAPPSA